MNKELLAEYGIDYESGLKNCMGNAELFEKLLSMFLDDQSFPNAALAHEQHDYRRLFESLHELKGICGNAGIIRLYNAVSPLVELVRFSTDDDIEVDRQFFGVEMIYKRACEGITAAFKESE